MRLQVSGDAVCIAKCSPSVKLRDEDREPGKMGQQLLLALSKNLLNPIGSVVNALALDLGEGLLFSEFMYDDNQRVRMIAILRPAKTMTEGKFSGLSREGMRAVAAAFFVEGEDSDAVIAMNNAAAQLGISSETVAQYIAAFFEAAGMDPHPDNIKKMFPYLHKLNKEMDDKDSPKLEIEGKAVGLDEARAMGAADEDRSLWDEKRKQLEREHQWERLLRDLPDDMMGRA